MICKECKSRMIWNSSIDIEDTENTLDLYSCSNCDYFEEVLIEAEEDEYCDYCPY